MGTHTLDQHRSSVGTHTGSRPVWGQALDQHHIKSRQAEVESNYMYGDTHWINCDPHWVWAGWPQLYEERLESMGWGLVEEYHRLTIALRVYIIIIQGSDSASIFRFRLVELLSKFNIANSLPLRVEGLHVQFSIYIHTLLSYDFHWLISIVIVCWRYRSWDRSSLSYICLAFQAFLDARSHENYY